MPGSENYRERDDVVDMARSLPEQPGAPLPPRPLAVVASVIAAIIENEGAREPRDNPNRSER